MPLIKRILFRLYLFLFGMTAEEYHEFAVEADRLEDR